jgi:hypothetical protein
VNDKLLICPWYGDLPVWWEQYAAQFSMLDSMGYDLLLPRARLAAEYTIEDLLGVEVKLPRGGSKMHDIRPLLGLMYQDHIKRGGYRWWGHTDFDCVYGRLDSFVTDDVLADCDVYSDCAYDYLSGPFTLYRVGVTEELFRQVPDWREQLERSETTGWVEKGFTDAAYRNLRVKVENNHAFQRPDLLRRDGDRLMHGADEISYFHFKRTKEWPL